MCACPKKFPVFVRKLLTVMDRTLGLVKNNMDIYSSYYSDIITTLSSQDHKTNLYKYLK